MICISYKHLYFMVLIFVFNLFPKSLPLNTVHCVLLKLVGNYERVVFNLSCWRWTVLLGQTAVRSFFKHKRLCSKNTSEHASFEISRVLIGGSMLILN